MKRLFSILIVLAALVSFSGCSMDNGAKRSIYNDDSKIVEQGDSFSFFAHSASFDNNTIKVSFNKFAGKKQLIGIHGKDKGEITIHYSCKVKSGKLKVVLVTDQKEIRKVFEQDASGSVNIEVPAGKNRIIMLGDNAKASLEISFEAGENFEVTHDVD